jgi:hypothetical protein
MRLRAASRRVARAMGIMTRIILDQFATMSMAWKMPGREG